MFEAQGADIARMMRAGGLLLVSREQILAIKGQLINYAEFGDFGQVWVCPADGRIPDYLTHPEWPMEHLADPDRRKDMGNPDLIRVTLRQPERIGMILSLQHQCEALVSAHSRGAGAVLLDGVSVDISATALAIIRAVQAGQLVVAATHSQLMEILFGPDVNPLQVLDPEGLYLPSSAVPPDADVAFMDRLPDDILARRPAAGQ